MILKHIDRSKFKVHDKRSVSIEKENKKKFINSNSEYSYSKFHN